MMQYSRSKAVLKLFGLFLLSCTLLLIISCNAIFIGFIRIVNTSTQFAISQVYISPHGHTWGDDLLNGEISPHGDLGEFVVDTGSHDILVYDENSHSAQVDSIFVGIRDIVYLYYDDNSDVLSE